MIQMLVSGRLGKDAEIKHIGTNTVINFSIGVSVGYGDKKETVWVDCAKWGEKTGVAAYLKKGTQVVAIGEGGIRKWEGGATMTLRVMELELVGGKKENSDTPSTQNRAEDISEPPVDDLPF
jgi:single-strand DNA-binding protein